MPGRSGGGRAGDLALGLHHPGEAGRGDAERQRHPLAQHLARGVDGRDVAQDRRVELDVAERLPRPGQRDLAVGGAVGVVERGLRRTPLGDPAQVLDRQRRREPALLGRPDRPLEPEQGRQVVALRQLPLHRSDSITIRGDARRVPSAQWVQASHEEATGGCDPGRGARRGGGPRPAAEAARDPAQLPGGRARALLAGGDRPGAAAVHRRRQRRGAAVQPRPAPLGLRVGASCRTTTSGSAPTTTSSTATAT